MTGTAGGAPILRHPAAADGIAGHVADFLADLEQAGRPANTVRAYRSDLSAFVSYHAGPLAAVTPEVLRAYFGGLADRAPATRARKQAALASFLGWCFAQDRIGSDPMGKVRRVRTEAPPPRGVVPELVERVLKGIPANKKRDRLLFRLIYEMGLRASEALGLYVEDLDMSRDDERIRVRGKGGRHRTVLLDDPALVRQLHGYLKDTGYKHGALFRAEKNGRGGPLAYHSARELWEGYCRRAGVSCTLHQLRHTHATALVNGGVSLETIRRRLGHRSMQTTLRYAAQSDAVSDAEMREWRRRRGR